MYCKCFKPAHTEDSWHMPSFLKLIAICMLCHSVCTMSVSCTVPINEKSNNYCFLLHLLFYFTNWNGLAIKCFLNFSHSFHDKRRFTSCTYVCMYITNNKLMFYHPKTRYLLQVKPVNLLECYVVPADSSKLIHKITQVTALKFYKNTSAFITLQLECSRPTKNSI